MHTMKLSKHQTRKFWYECCDAVDWVMGDIDNYLYSKYSIVKREWDSNRALKLTFNEPHYITFLTLYLCHI